MHGQSGSRGGRIVRPDSLEANDRLLAVRLSELMEWEVLAGHCGDCKRVGMLDAKKIRRVFGDIDLRNVRQRLVCRGCWNRRRNSVMIGKLPR